MHEVEVSGVGEQSAWLAAARTGDSDAFRGLIDPHQHELLIHCYRILGSVEEAEDVLQETWLRAWRRLESFEGRASLRAWLYKIATNVALDTLGRRRHRAARLASPVPARPGDPLPPPQPDLIWLEPLPDTLIDERPIFNPEARYEVHESVTLAFLSALQNLPGRQRAVLILRDVLGWQAREVADLLDTSVQAVNSALQRARTTMKQYDRDRLAPATPAADAQTTALLARYVAAWEAADVPALVALLHDDGVMTMPPIPAWYQGRAAIQWFLTTYLFPGPARHRFRLVATRANGSPAFALYERDAAGNYRASALHVLAIRGDEIAAINCFLAAADGQFARFGLPLVL